MRVQPVSPSLLLLAALLPGFVEVGVMLGLPSLPPSESDCMPIHWWHLYVQQQ